MEVVSFRPFRIPKPAETQFFSPDDSANLRFMEEDLARSGLLPDDMMAYTTPFIKKDGATAAYSIPYFGLDGKPLTDDKGFPVMYRTRFKLPEFSREQRYTQPSKEALLKFDLPSTVPYIHPKTLELKHDYIICCEGEKKTAAVIKHLGIPAFGIGGCQMWRDPSGSGGPHPWIRKLLSGNKKLVIIPDGDVLRYDICNAYGTFAATLRSEGYDVELLNPPGKIDDLLALWEDKIGSFNALPRLDPTALVQSSVSLAKRYNLAFKQNDKGVITVHQHTSNVMKLMEEHPAFPKVWRNTDNNRVMLGDNYAQPDLTEMDIANYFQHNLGFDKVGSKMIYSCVQALARRNSRSPMLEYVKSLEWDKTPRLEDWMIRLWGAEDDNFTREVSAKWLTSACARMDRPGTKIDWMLIVVGPQGTGKTSMPGILFRGNNVTLYGDHNDKDLHMLLHSALCVGFDELDSFGKRESSNLKAMVTRNEDAFRPPYGASVEIFPRRFTLYGCGNRYEFLQHDPSGYRRYAILEIDKLLDFKGLEAERDQLWAEAWQRYSSGDRFWEIEGASKHAEEYVAPNPMEDQIINIIEGWKKGKANTNVKDGVVYFTMTGLLCALNMERESRNTHVTREISAILRALGAERNNGSCPTGMIRGRYYSLPI
jgi:hypothetical protein